MTFKLEPPDQTFENKLLALIEFTQKKDRNYHLNDNVRELIKAKEQYFDMVKMFSWFKGCIIETEGPVVTIKAPNEWHAKQIKGRYSRMLKDYYQKEVRIL